MPLPYLCDWPLPIDQKVYRAVFNERSDIEKIFINYDENWMKAVSVGEFLSLIDGVCGINKLYKCKYEWKGSLIGDISGEYKISPISPEEIYFEHMPEYFQVKYVKDTFGEDSDGWPSCSSHTRFISSNGSKEVCYDTYSNDMSSYYGGNKYIELLENIEDSEFYDPKEQKG